MPVEQLMEHGAGHRDEIADQGETGCQHAHRRPVERMPQLLGALHHRAAVTVLGHQGQKPVAQGRRRPEQEVPENHRKKTLVRLPQQVALHALE
ncbi:hypothetical protein D3C76_1540190 [compost metagenome]